MDRVVPNTDPVGADRCLTPVVLKVPVVIVDNGADCHWYAEPMDHSTADRMAFSMLQGMEVEAIRVDVEVILPSASDVRATTAELSSLKSDPVRAVLRASQ